MRTVRQIAWREMKQYLSTRGFWIGIIMVPLIFGALRFLPALRESSAPVRHFVVADLEGSYSDVIDAALAKRRRQALLRALGAYADEYAAPDAADAVEEILAAAEDEGDTPQADQSWTEAVLARLAPHLRADRPAFDAPRPRLVRLALPGGMPRLGDADALAEALTPYLLGDRMVQVEGAPVRLYAGLIIMPGTQDDPAPRVEYWSDDTLGDVLDQDSPLNSFLAYVLTREYQARRYAEQGLDPAVVERVQRAVIDFETRKPARPGAPRAKPEDGTGASVAERVRRGVSSLLPIGLAYMLLISIFSMAGILLTNVIEEKSNRIVELLLSSVTPMQLMLGKLIGVAGIGLVTIFAWTFGALLALTAGNEAMPLASGGVFRELLASNLLPAFFAYFVPGYLMYAAVFLGVGSMCNSVSDAQAYLGPLMAAMFVPLLLVGVILLDPNGTLARVISWIPLYTPYFMMLRLGANPPLIDIVGSYLLMLATMVLLVWLMARLFRNSILRTGQPPKLLEIFRLIRAR